MGLLQNWRRMIMQLHTGSLINITSDLREWESRSIGRSTDQTKLLSVNRKQFPRSLNFRLVLLCDLSSFGPFALSPHAPPPLDGVTGILLYKHESTHRGRPSQQIFRLYCICLGAIFGGRILSSPGRPGAQGGLRVGCCHEFNLDIHVRYYKDRG